MSQCLYVLLSRNSPSLITECQRTNGRLSKRRMLLCEISSGNDDIFEEGGITPYILAQAVHFEFEVHWKGKLTTGKHAERSTNPPGAHVNVCVLDLSSSSGTWSSVWFDRPAVSGPKDTPLLTDRWGPEFLTLVSLTSPRVLLTGWGAEPVTMWVSATSHFYKKLIGTGSYGEFEKLCQPSTVQVPGGQEPQTIFLWLVLITK